MPTTAKGTPYVVSTDLVANYPTVSSDLADHIDDKLAYNAISINAQTGSGANAYTFALADASEGKLVTASNAAAATYTVPPQSSVTWAAGAVLRILNQGAGVVTIAAGAGVTINGTPLTLAQYKGAAIQRTASNTWTFLPFASGAGNADFSNTATGTYTAGGVSYKYVTFTASGTLTATAAGTALVLVAGGGGGGGEGSNRIGGGGAGAVRYETVTLAAQSYTVTVGGGGAAGGFVGTQGGTSSLGTVVACGGGAGGIGSPASTAIASAHATGGGHAGGVYVASGSTGSREGMGAGTSATVTQGFTSSITGSSYEYGIGGKTPSSTNYGSGRWAGENGAAGVVIVAVAT
jgi:hypothetical protein